MIFSIIIPVYNVEKYLDECVQSVLNQDYGDYEIILVDDGSTDNSPQICDRYAEMSKSIRVIHKENGGLGSARNAGFRIAQGKYILFLDSDDYLKSNSLGVLLKTAEYYHTDIVLFCSSILTEDSITRENHYLRIGKEFNVIRSGTEGIREELESDCYITSVCMRLYNREFLLSTSLLFNEDFIHEDEDYSFISYLKANRVVAIEDQLYVRRYRMGSILDSKTYRRFADGYIYAISSIYNYGKNTHDSIVINLAKRYNRNLIDNVIKEFCFLDSSGRKNNWKTYERSIDTIRDQEFAYGFFYRVYFKHIRIMTPIVRVLLGVKYGYAKTTTGI